MRKLLLITASLMLLVACNNGNRAEGTEDVDSTAQEDSLTLLDLLYHYRYGDIVFIVHDNQPNSNGWVTRFEVIYINDNTDESFSVDECAAVHFDTDGFKVAKCRLTNPDAKCTADEIWLMHNCYYNTEGKKVREDTEEYDYAHMEEEYGEELINVSKKS